MQERVCTGYAINVALIRFIGLHPDVPVDVAKHAFWMWLGMSFGVDRYKLDTDLFKMPEQAAQYIDMLNSPHYHALYKAYQIRNQQGD